eukprot:scaffold405494_cov29-Prasinocladus_malaysianus.AAC.1
MVSSPARGWAGRHRSRRPARTPGGSERCRFPGRRMAPETTPAAAARRRPRCAPSARQHHRRHNNRCMCRLPRPAELLYHSCTLRQSSDAIKSRQNNEHQSLLRQTNIANEKQSLSLLPS